MFPAFACLHRETRAKKNDALAGYKEKLDLDNCQEFKDPNSPYRYSSHKIERRLNEFNGGPYLYYSKLLIKSVGQF